MRFESEWVEDLRAKKELSALPSSFVQKVLCSVLVKNKQVQGKVDQSKSWLEFQRSKSCESVSKEVRRVLREVYGVFWEQKNRERLLHTLLDRPTLEAHEAILRTHASTRERLPYYKEMYNKIFYITGFPKQILDWACGLNPFSYPYLGCKPKYIASEISESDASFVQAYFDGMKVQGQAFAFDLLEFKKSPFLDFIRSDVCFLFKALDSLEALEWGFSERFLPDIPTAFLVVSFSTRSLGGKKEIKQEKRAWFERLLKKKGWSFSTFSLPNEFFYIVRKE